MKNSMTFKFAFLFTTSMLLNVFAFNTPISKKDPIQWYKIGETIVAPNNIINDVISITEMKISKIKIVIIDAPVEVDEMIIYYKNGDLQKIEIKQIIKLQGHSRIVELNGKERIIKKIVFQGRTLTVTEGLNAKIEVWGINEFE
jgi:hypothetical protein